MSLSFTILNDGEVKKMKGGGWGAISSYTAGLSFQDIRKV